MASSTGNHSPPVGILASYRFIVPEKKNTFITFFSLAYLSSFLFYFWVFIDPKIMFVVKNNRNKKIIDEHPVYANELEDKSEKYMFYM